MHAWLKAGLCLWMLVPTGCVVVPLPNETTKGRKDPAEALEFLDLPGTTRRETIASLGPPSYESPTNRVLVYVWEETPRYLMISLNPYSYPRSGSTGDSAFSQMNQSSSKDQWRDARHDLNNAGREALQAAGKAAAQAMLEGLGGDADDSQPASPATMLHGAPQPWGLFVAYDENGFVTAHTGWKTETDEASLEKKCAAWRKNGTRTNLHFKLVRIEPPKPPVTRR